MSFTLTIVKHPTLGRNDRNHPCWKWPSKSVEAYITEPETEVVDDQFCIYLMALLSIITRPLIRHATTAYASYGFHMLVHSLYLWRERHYCARACDIFVQECAEVKLVQRTCQEQRQQSTFITGTDGVDDHEQQKSF